MTTAPTISLTHGTGDSDVAMPLLGYGVYKVPADDAQQHVGAALRMGYRLIDTAKLYRNEEGVGAAVRESDLPREEIFVTTKVWNESQGYDETLKAFEASRARLGLDYVDLYLVHWPQPAKDRYVDTWRAVCKLREDGLIRAAGVSNFEPEHLQRIIDETGEIPAVNQIECNPYLTQEKVRAANAQHGIVTEAWRPIARAGELFADPAVAAIARETGATPAQVVLAWARAHDIVAIPKSVTPSRMQENLDSVQLTLTAEQVASLDDLNRDERSGPHPNEFND